jgi:anti-sigma B factor antagonist
VEAFEVGTFVADEYVVLAVSGELDIGTVEQLRAALATVAENRPGLVILDCGDLHFLDSTGLGLFVGAQKQLAASGSQLVLANVGTKVGKPIRITGIQNVIHVHWSDDTPWRPWTDDASAPLEHVARALGIHRPTAAPTGPHPSTDL